MELLQEMEEKIAFSIEKLSQVSRVLKWQVSKKENLSPIQTQSLIYLRNHPEEFCSVNNLAKEFDLREATISEAIKTLEGKGYIVKQQKKEDKRVFILSLTPEGLKVADKVSTWSDLLLKHIRQLPSDRKERIMLCMMEVIKSLQKAGVIGRARMCLSCANFQKDVHPGLKKPHHCTLTDTPMASRDLSIDCINYRIREDS